MMMVTLGLGLVIDYSLQAISRNNILRVHGAAERSAALGACNPHTHSGDCDRHRVGYFPGPSTFPPALTRIGKALRAMAADAALARACGIRTGRIVIFTWLLSGGLADWPGWSTSSTRRVSVIPPASFSCRW